jgi:hypothetical protein
MTYFPDRAACTYFSREYNGQLVAIGWLDREQPYPKGTVDDRFVGKLVELLVKPWAPMYLLGYADCPFCEVPSYSLTHKQTTIAVGALNLFVPGQDFLYVAPSLIAHYIVDHNYAPPAEFCEAVLRCPPMGSKEYFQAIVKNGPASFADEV